MIDKGDLVCVKFHNSKVGEGSNQKILAFWKSLRSSLLSELTETDPSPSDPNLSFHLSGPCSFYNSCVSVLEMAHIPAIHTGGVWYS